MNTDLFGDVAITLRDIELWLFRIPKLPHTSCRRSAYTRQWNVIDKIRREKLAGSFHVTINGEDCEFCGQTLAAVSPVPTISPAAELDLLKRRVAVLEMVLLAATLPKVRSARAGAACPE